MRRLFYTIAIILTAFPAKAQFGFPSFADLAEKLLPSVVNISTVQQVETIELIGKDNQNIYAPAQERVALGSGFIIDNDGYIITNSHVIENAQEVNVVLFDNTEVEAEIIGVDEKTDIALIKIEPPFELDKVKFGNSDELRVGDWILAIGNPFGLGGSITAGIVSAKSRDIAAGPYDSFIQTDASINQGNSGGPMFNTKGEVIGINTAIFSTSGNNMGIGFAVPINMAGWIISQLEQNGEVKRGWIGIKIQPNSKELAKDLNLKENQGVIVSEVSENSPAAKAGIMVGDAIISFGKTEITNSKDFSRLIAETPAGDEIHLMIWRKQEIVQLTIVVQNMPKSPNAINNDETSSINENDRIVKETGFKLREITPDIIKKFNLSPTTMGLLVEGVEANSDAAKKGLKHGDIVLKIDKKDVVTLDAASEYISEARLENNRPIMLLIQPQEQDSINVLSIKLK